MYLSNHKIQLRALEPEDLEFLYQIENNEIFWEVSHTLQPFSKFSLKQYLEHAHLEIYETKQLRFIIEDLATKNQLGMIDLFDFNPHHQRAGVGILIHPNHQHKGIASEALTLCINYVFQHLRIHQLFANITSDNLFSYRLFQKHGFKAIGTKKDWIYTQGIFKDETLFQLIHEEK